MIRSLFACVIAFAGLAALGCAPEATSPDGGGGGGKGGTGGSGGATVTYTHDVQPIFMAKCATCHTTDGAGAHNIATNYQDAFKMVMTIDAPAGCFKDGDAKTMPKTIGECTLPSIMEGWMPMGMYCFNTPRPSTCVSLAEQDIVAAWIAAGMPQ